MNKRKKNTPTISKIVKEYKDATTTEIWEGVEIISFMVLSVLH